MAQPQGFHRVRRPPAEDMAPPSRNPDSGVTTFAGGLRTGGQVQDFGGGTFGVSAAPGSHGDTSPNFYDDPTVNEIVKLPSLAEASQYMGSQPTFHGVQRPGDYQRVVQRQMANDMTGGMLGQMIKNRVDAAKAKAGDSSASAYDVAGAMGGLEAPRGNPNDYRIRPGGGWQ